MTESITVAEYLFTRLRQHGVESIHGVPGDYNLEMLDYVDKQDLHWVGSCNELNAAYATDGYSRIKGLGALITTFGVGELSALNAIAGSFAEYVPVVHIVGTPARSLQESGAFIHHTLGDGNFRHFADMATHVTVAQANLIDLRTCAALIDSTIQQCILYSRPVYIQIPTDIVSRRIPSKSLESKIVIPDSISSNEQSGALDFLLDRISNSRRPILLVDGESQSIGICKEIDELIKLTHWPTWTTTFGKGLVDEELGNVRGIWMANSASQEDQDLFQSADLILCFGPHFSNTNTYGLTTIPDPDISILFKPTSITCQQQTFRDLSVKDLLLLMLDKLGHNKSSVDWADCKPTHGLNRDQHDAPDEPISQKNLYSILDNYIRSGDIILAETGTAGHGCRVLHLPTNVTLIKPVTWLSIGYMLPAAQGAALARRELLAKDEQRQGSVSTASRAILLCGDGSFQVSGQELSTIIREELNVLVILINNAGYTIERCIHGKDRRYNDIAAWNYLLAPALFGAKDDKQAGYHSRTVTLKTRGQLEDTLALENKANTPALSMIEVVLDKEDAPDSLLNLLRRQQKG